MKKKYGFSWGIPLFLIAMIGIFRMIPSWAEAYACLFYPFISTLLSAFSSLFPFSVGDCFIVGTCLWILIYPFYAWRKRKGAKKTVGTIIRVLMWVYIWFYFAWGLNYFRFPFYERTGIAKAAFSAEKFQDFPRDLCYNQVHPQRERRPDMSRKKRKRGRGRVLILVVLLALIVFGVFARGIFTSGKTTTEHAQRELHTYAEQHETSLADYPDALVQLYARNPDARDFVRDYPKKKDLTPTIDLSNLSGSKTVPLLLQWDERWGYREYNESIIGLAGCGPTCLSMATIYLTGDTTKDPLWMCRFAEQNQFNVPGSGSKWALISEGGRMLGLDVTQIPLDKDRIYRNLDVGNPIIVVVGPGDFTTDGHFLVLTGHSGDKITLNDPNSPTNSAKSWDYDTLAGQIQALWVLRRAG